MSRRTSRWLVFAGVGSAALAAAFAGDTPRAAAFGWDGFQSIHARITRNAFPFMADGVLGTVIDGNLDEDQGDEADLAERHGVNCRFRDGAAYANMRYQQVVAALR